jgi:hypothetical protein
LPLYRGKALHNLTNELQKYRIVLQRYRRFVGWDKVLWKEREIQYITVVTIKINMNLEQAL